MHVIVTLKYCYLHITWRYWQVHMSKYGWFWLRKNWWVRLTNARTRMALKNCGYSYYLKLWNIVIWNSFQQNYKINFSKKKYQLAICWKINPVELTKPLPDFIAVWVPFIFGTFMKPAEHPIIAPPGKTGYGIDWNLTRITFVFVMSRK